MWLRVAVGLAAVGVPGAWYAYRQGFWLDVFAAERYGALVVSAVVDTSYKESEEVFFQPVLYREEDGSLSPLSSLSFGLHEDTAASSGSTFLIESKRCSFPPARYRLKVSLERRAVLELASRWTRGRCSGGSCPRRMRLHHVSGSRSRERLLEVRVTVPSMLGRVRT